MNSSEKVVVIFCFWWGCDKPKSDIVCTNLWLCDLVRFEGGESLWGGGVSL